MNETLNGWLERLEKRHPRAIDLGLDRCGRVWDRLGRPRPAPRIWTIAGTNGKGSVAACLCALLQAGGRRVGCYTSPHLLTFNERVQIDGAPAGDADLVAAFEQVEAARGDVSLTYFEFTSLAAFLLLAQAELDAAVLEVGLGGRLDAVNLTDADCAVITRIGLDHQDYLGSTREEIGREKAGIVRASRPVVIGDPEPPASLLQRAGEVAAKPWLIGRDFDLCADAQGAVFRIGDRAMACPAPPLPGAHQWHNFATAIAALAVLEPDLLERGDTLQQAADAVRLPGRLQRWEDDPRVVLDVGHNPLAAEVTAHWLAQQPRRHRRCVLGLLADKDAEGVARALADEIDAWFCAGLGGLRGQGGEALAGRIAPVCEGAVVSAWTDVPAALQAARARLAPDDTLLVFGSFQTVADAVLALRRNADHAGDSC